MKKKYNSYGLNVTKRIKRLEQNGYKTIHICFNLFLIRKYSKLCSSSFWKRNCPIYHLVKIKEDNQ
jgi:hypothetical protein